MADCKKKKKKTLRKSETLVSLARRLRSVESVLRAARRDPSLWAKALSDDSIARRMIGQLIRDVWHEERGRVRNLVSRDARPLGEVLGDAMDDLRSVLLEWPLYGGEPMGAARAVDLSRSAAARRDQIEAHSTAARFEEAVAYRMGASRRTVGEMLSEDELLTIYEHAAEED